MLKIKSLQGIRYGDFNFGVSISFNQSIMYKNNICNIIFKLNILYKYENLLEQSEIKELINEIC